MAEGYEYRDANYRLKYGRKLYGNAATLRIHRVAVGKDSYEDDHTRKVVRMTLDEIEKGRSQPALREVK